MPPEVPPGSSNETPPAPSEAGPPAPVRVRPCKELAQQFAKLMREALDARDAAADAGDGDYDDWAHRVGVCAKMVLPSGRQALPYRTFKRWMAEDVEPDTDHAEFQSIVNQSLQEAISRDIRRIRKDIRGAHPAQAIAYVNVHTFHHNNRFKGFYAADDEPKASKVELTGKDGKPLQTEDVSKPLSREGALRLKADFLGIPMHMLVKPADGEPTE